MVCPGPSRAPRTALGNRWLRHVQNIGGPGEPPLVHNLEEDGEATDIHSRILMAIIVISYLFDFCLLGRKAGFVQTQRAPARPGVAGSRAGLMTAKAETERTRVPPPGLVRKRIAPGRGATEQPNATGDGDAAYTSLPG